MDNTCIPPELIESVKRIVLTSGDSIARNKQLLEVFGGNQKMVDSINTSFEKSLLLKNQEKAFDKFVDSLTGADATKKANLKQAIKDRLANRQNRILEEDELLSLAKETLLKKKGVEVSLDTMKNIQTLKRDSVQLENKYKETGSLKDRMDWGRKEVEYIDFINEQKGKNETIGKIFTNAKDRITGAYEKGGILPATGRALAETGNLAFSSAFKGIKASWDLSAPLRQGLKVLSSNPSAWKSSTGKSLSIAKEIFSKSNIDKAYNDFRASTITDPLYKDAVDSGLALGAIEDFFPESPLTKIPVLENIFKTSDAAYTTFIQNARFDLFKNYVKQYEMTNGAKPSEDILKGLARVSNSVTGRGGLKGLEQNADLLNKVLFSARYQTANINTVRHAFDSTLPKEAQVVARKNLAKHIVMLGGMMSAFSAFGDVGFDPNESTFGKVRIPGSKKWVDLTGGLAGYLVPAFKMANKLGDGKKLGYKEESSKDIIYKFLEGKLAPAPGVVRDVLSERDYSGKKPTVGSVAKGLFVPITLENIQEGISEDEDAKILAISTLLEMFGASTTEPKSKREGSYKSVIDIVTGN